jgi:hypothetical protein
MSRRPLADTLVDLAESMALTPAAAHGLRVRDFELTLPVEVALLRHADELLLSADLPRWRWRSAFDRRPGRVALHLVEGTPR